MDEKIQKQEVIAVLNPDIPIAPNYEQAMQIGNIEAFPFQGGCNTALEAQQIPLGMYSMVQNMRPTHPGFKKRKGQRKLHSTADESNSAMTMYQFSKGSRDEKHFYAQMSDGDVLEATNPPPIVTTGVFGSEKFNGDAASSPAAWSIIKDQMLFSNGKDQHQIYAGDVTYVNKLIKYDGTGAPPTIPTLGFDYTEKVVDGLTTTAAILDSLNTYANHECLFVMTEMVANGFTVTISLPNGTASVISIYYWNGAWTQVSGLFDGTDVGGATLAKTGSITFTMPTDAIPNYMYGVNGYWWRIQVSTQLDSEVEVTSLTYSSDWQEMKNVWDGVLVDAIETQFYDASADVYYTLPSSSVEIDSMTASDKLYLSSFYPICGIYIDVGSKPNTTATTAINAIYYWSGTEWVSVGTISDGTNGLSNSGWVTFARCASEKRQVNENQYYAHWYYFTVDKTLSDDVILSMSTMPYFDIDELGRGYCNAAWKNRAVYAFDRDHFIHVSAADKPQSLNGSDYAILEPGDGRSNKVVAMKKFHNELMVWQEEKGVEGGCLTLFEGYSPATFGKLLLSTKIGTLNAKCVEVVDGVYFSTKTDEVVSTMAYFLSHYGVFASNGKYVVKISDDIGNYFDPTKSECIRDGYENQMWLKYDSAHDVLRLGLVSGESATSCNIFPIYDLKDKGWMFDVFEQNLTCMTEVEADSGDVSVLQIVGGTGDGFIYQSNYGNDDVDTAIDSYTLLEINGKGREMLLREFIIRLRKNEGGCTVTPYIDGIAQTAITID